MGAALPTISLKPRRVLELSQGVSKGPKGIGHPILKKPETMQTPSTYGYGYHPFAPLVIDPSLAMRMEDIIKHPHRGSLPLEHMEELRVNRMPRTFFDRSLGSVLYQVIRRNSKKRTRSLMETVARHASRAYLESGAAHEDLGPYNGAPESWLFSPPQVDCEMTKCLEVEDAREQDTTDVKENKHETVNERIVDSLAQQSVSATEVIDEETVSVVPTRGPETWGEMLDSYMIDGDSFMEGFDGPVMDASDFRAQQMVAAASQIPSVSVADHSQSPATTSPQNHVHALVARSTPAKTRPQLHENSSLKTSATATAHAIPIWKITDPDTELLAAILRKAEEPINMMASDGKHIPNTVGPMVSVSVSCRGPVTVVFRCGDETSVQQQTVALAPAANTSAAVTPGPAQDQEPPKTPPHRQESSSPVMEELCQGERVFIAKTMKEIPALHRSPTPSPIRGHRPIARDLVDTPTPVLRRDSFAHLATTPATPSKRSVGRPRKQPPQGDYISPYEPIAFTAEQAKKTSLTGEALKIPEAWVRNAEQAAYLGRLDYQLVEWRDWVRQLRRVMREVGPEQAPTFEGSDVMSEGLCSMHVGW
ncbi:MAG: hypothetical protein M1817_004345 [Caeruleum heppii]|nr:MAG: hypothetical protein M1817_004345 [Caeruleum heppii]